MENKTVVLLVYGDGDYGAMTFEQNFDPQKVYEEMVAEGKKRKIVVYDDPSYGEEDLYVAIYEFGPVDKKFVSFVVDEFMDYDAMKARDFYFVEAV